MSVTLGSASGRPLGITLIAAYYIISALLVLLIFVGFAGQPERELSGLNPLAKLLHDVTNPRGGALEIYAAVVIGVTLAIGLGLWRLRSWALYVTILDSILGLITNVFSDISRGITTGQFAGLIIHTGIIIYLLRPRVRQAFTR
jgi:hypothetical protein